MTNLYSQVKAQKALKRGNYTGNSFVFPEDYDEPGTYTARDYIKINPEFNYEADTRNPLCLKTNPMLINEPTEGSETGGWSADENGVVGTIEGNFSVSPSGAAIYSIPLKLPPGIAGMTPELGLVYNSQAGDGVMGQGWAISGLSSITRTAQTYYYNDQPGAINFSDDQLMLDGQKIIPIGGDKYRTEIDGFSKIEQIDGEDGYFKVYTKSGLIKTYGNTSDSKQILSSSSQEDQPLIWHLNRIEDRLGNYIDFEYLRNPDNGEVNIKRIYYTKHTSKSSKDYQFKVQFVYSDLPTTHFSRAYFSYGSSGGYIEKTQKLDFIKIFNKNNNIVKRYKLEYEQLGLFNKHFFRRLQEFGSDNTTTYNKTWFTWTSNFNSDFSIESSIELFIPIYNTEVEEYVYLPIDIDGDGDHEIIHEKGYYYDGRYLRVEDHNILDVLDFEAVEIGDFNADNKEELLLFKDEVMTLIEFSKDDDGNISHVATSYNNISADANHVVGDYNGDGILDLLFEKDDNYVVSFGNHEGINFNETTGTVTNAIDDNDLVLPGDYDGDGKTDICIVGTNYGKIYKMNSNNSAFSSSYATIGELKSWMNVKTGDFNGDGKTDIVTPYSNKNNKGNGDKEIDQLNIYFFPIHNDVYMQEYNCNWAGENFSVADVNNDGRSDFVYTAPYLGNEMLYIKYTKPNGYSFHSSSVYLEAVHDLVSFKSNEIFVKIDEEGKSDICVPRCHADPAYSAQYIYGFAEKDCYIYSTDDKNEDYIHKISNGLNKRIQIDYRTLSSSNNNYEIQDEYPVTKLISPMLLVREVSYNLFNTSKFYTFAGGKTHRRGKGFLGFERIVESDHYSNIHTNTLNEVNEDYYFLETKSVTKNVGRPGHQNYVVISYKENQYNYKSTVPDKDLIFFPYIEKSTVTEKELNDKVKCITETYSEYDLYGNPTRIREKKGAEEGSLNYVQNNTNVYDNDETNWILGKLQQASVLKKAPGTANINRTSSFDYNTYGMITTETIEPGNPDVERIKQYVYDFDLGETAYGNIRETTVSATGEPPRTTETIYDNHGRFVVEKINPEGHHEYYDHDNWGNVVEYTDPNGLTTTHDYDAFGRLKETQHPDGNKTVVRYRWVDDNFMNAVYFKWIKTTGSHPSKVYYNKYNKKERTVKINMNGEETYVDYFYDDKLRLSEKTRPYFEGTTSNTIKYHYDDVNRIDYTIQDWADSKTKKVDYGYDVVEDDNGNKYTQLKKEISFRGAVVWETKKQYNAAGWLVKSYDNSSDGNAVTYKYNSSGKVLSTTINDIDSRKIQMQYDIVGNRTSLNDPDIGQVTWTYNGFGEMKTKTIDGNQVISSTTYDMLGRITGQSTTEGVITKVYDTRPNGKGAIAQITMNYNDGYGNTASYQRDYYYNEDSRLKKTVEKINGEEYVVKHLYDIYGRERSLEYPSGYKVYNSYTPGGYLDKKTDNRNHTIWEAKSRNHFGQIEEFVVGDDAHTYHFYNEYSGFLEGIISRKNETHWYQDIGYEWNGLGNLTAREYYNKELREDFTYDDLQRLETVTLNNSKVTQSMTYDKFGNIITKSDVGTYNYDNTSKPNQLTSIDGNPDIISDFTQQLKYTSFNKVCRAEENGATMNLIYGFGRQRVIQNLQEADGFETTKTYVLGLYEKIETSDGNTKELHYINTPTGLAAIYTIENETDREINYILNDHLGSMHVVLDEAGNIEEEYSYDAWGLRRNPNTFLPYTTPQEPKFSFGYTGHEHHDLFNLINMNGRVYDPTIGRFVSPDPNIPDPGYTQSLNRYAYCYNSPLALVDPSGYSSEGGLFGSILQIAATMAIGSIPGIGPIAAAAISGFGGGLTGALLNGAEFGDALVVGFQACALATMSASNAMMIGDIGKSLMKTSKFLGTMVKIGMHGASQGAMREAQGGKFIHGFIAGAAGSLSGNTTSGMQSKLGRVATAAAISGTAEELSGGKFANGAVTGAFVVMFNDLMHDPSLIGREFNNSEKLRQYMYKTSGKENVEIAAFAFKNKEDGSMKFFVLPWAKPGFGNEPCRSWNFPEMLEGYTDSGYSTIAQIHTHNSCPDGVTNPGLSYDDLDVWLDWGVRYMFAIEHGNVIYGVDNHYAPVKTTTDRWGEIYDEFPF